MFNLAIFSIITIALGFFYREFFSLRLKRQEADCACTLNELNRLKDFRKSLDMENVFLNKRFRGNPGAL